MEGIINLPLFIISVIIIIIAPGPDFIYVTTRGISEGNKAGVISAFGVSVGLLIHTLFAALGLSAIIQASRIIYVIIKYTGAAYLIYLGIKAIITRSGSNNYTAEKKTGNGNIFKQAILTNVFNPKAIVTFMAFMPQFVDVNISAPIIQFTVLGLILAGLATLWFGCVGYFAGKIGGWIRRNIFFQRIIRYLSASVMIALGLRLAIKKE